MTSPQNENFCWKIIFFFHYRQAVLAIGYNFPTSFSKVYIWAQVYNKLNEQSKKLITLLLYSLIASLPNNLIT